MTHTPIVFDRFHVMGYLGKAVDTVRKQEHRELMASGDERFKGSKYPWLYSQEHVPERRRDEFDGLRRKALMVGCALVIKEPLRRLLRTGHREHADRCNVDTRIAYGERRDRGGEHVDR